MTRYAIDAGTALRLIQDGVSVDDHQLVGPSRLRSDALSMLYTDVRQGTYDDQTGREHLEELAALKIRLLNDRVSRAVAWKLASRLDLNDIALAEYLAVASLQADALIAEDEILRAAADGIVPLANFADLTR